MHFWRMVGSPRCAKKKGFPDFFLYLCNRKKETTMKIGVTKTFAKFVNDTAKEMGFEAHAEVVSIRSVSQYQLSVGDLGDAAEGGDYDWETRELKALMITYPAEYYATPVYFSTKRLVTEAHRRGVKTIEALKKMIRDLFEI